MKDYEKYHHVISHIDAKDEAVVKGILDERGLYSKPDIFPLASLQLELTSHCNAACKHCYNNSGAANNAPDLMTPERWVAFSKYLVEHGGVFECLLSGGEPLLLGESLFTIMDILHDDGTLFLLQTNGSLLTDESAKRLKKYHYHWLQISIDGVNAEYHDSFRQKHGSWEKAVRAAASVASNGIPLKIAHCITPENLNDVDAMCDFAYALGASAITIGELCLSGRTALNQDLLLSREQRNVLYQKVHENSDRYQRRMIVKSSNSVRSGLERQRKVPYSAALIRPNGDVRIDGMAPFVIGNILLEDFTEIWSKKLKACWESCAVSDFISNFNDDDRNDSLINFFDHDIYV